VQAHTNAGRVLGVVDDARLLRGQLEHVMNGADTDGHASRSRRNSTPPRFELRQISGSPTITWRSQAQPCLGGRQLEEHFASLRG
jgi:hypothetical protein